ncbi:MAG: PhzF family phenazine biosynthesis protein [Candidatus Thorarchaeota archaeon]
MRQIPYVQTSVFVDERYNNTGNQLATFWDSSKNNLNQEEMQSIAFELNFSETTFIFESNISQCSKKVRIFTPKSELKFAGHPTLGTAFVLKDTKVIDTNVSKTVLELGVGPIEVLYISDTEIAMTQPKPTFHEKFKDKSTIAKILGITENDIDDDYPIEIVSTGFPFLIIPLKNLGAIQKIRLQPQLQLELLSHLETSKILVFTTEVTHNDSSVHVRMFAPSVGVLEDPATGSAAGPLTAYLDKYQILSEYKTGDEVFIEQGFEINRPSKLIGKIITKGSEITNVSVSGKVRKTASGKFYLK